MGTPPTQLPCDGCGLPASPEHIAQRLQRLELSTRYRPVHIGTLFVSFAPPIRPEDDFYAPAEAKVFFGPFLDGLDIRRSAEKPGAAAETLAEDQARLAEFQHRGHYLVSLSECPIPENKEAPESTIARLAPTLIRRIRFNYRPKHIAPMGQELLPLVDVLRAAGMGPLLILDEGAPLPIPGPGAREWTALFQRAVASMAPPELDSPGYDRIQLTQSESDLGAGGGT
jgi:hypothetical protein